MEHAFQWTNSGDSRDLARYHREVQHGDGKTGWSSEWDQWTRLKSGSR